MAERDRVAGLEAEIASLRAENAELRDAISELRNKVADLEAKLVQTSKDSSVPPSRDPNTARAEAKTNRAERRKAEREQESNPARQDVTWPGG